MALSKSWFRNHLSVISVSENIGEKKSSFLTYGYPHVLSCHWGGLQHAYAVPFGILEHHKIADTGNIHWFAYHFAT